MKYSDFSKKSLTVFVSLLLVFVCLPLGFTPTAAGNNFLKNPGFENGTDIAADNWGLYPGWETGNYISLNEAHKGGKAIRFVLDPNQNYTLFSEEYKSGAFTLNEALTLRMWVKYENITGGFSIGIERNYRGVAVDKSFSDEFTGSSDGWVRISYDIPAITNKLNNDIVKVEIEKGSGTLYIDDIELCYTSDVSDEEEEEDDTQGSDTEKTDTGYIINGSFEDGGSTEASSWGLSSGWRSNAFSSDSYDGRRAIAVTLSGSETNLFQSSAWNSEKYDLKTAKQISVWVKYTDISGEGVSIRAERKKNDAGVANVQSNALTGSSDAYVKLELIVPPTEEDIDEFIVSVIASGSGTLLIDCVSMTDYTGELPPDDDTDNKEPDNKDRNLVLNGSFENGSSTEASSWGLTSGWNSNAFSYDSYDGERAIKITLSGNETNLFQSSAWNSEKYDLKTAKRITAYIKCTDVSGAGVLIRAERKKNDAGVANVQSKAVIGTNDGYTELELLVPATDEAIEEFIVSVIASGSGTVLIDSISMSEYTGEIPDNNAGNGEDQNKPVKNYNLLLNGSFEEGENEALAWGLSSGWNRNALSGAGYDGNRSIALNANNEEQNLFQSSVWNPNADYSLSSAKQLCAYVKCDNLSGGVYLKVERKAKDIAVANATGAGHSGTDSEWKKLTLIVPATKEDIDELIVSVVCGMGSGRVLIDKVTLTDYTPSANAITAQTNTDTNLFINGSFEQGTVNEAVGWGIGTGWKNSYFSKDAYDGSRAVYIAQGNDSVNLFQSNAWNNEVKYNLKSAKEITVWVKCKNLTGTGIFLLVERKYKDSVVSSVSSTAVNGSTNGWQKLSLILPPTSQKVQEFVFSVVVSSGTGSVLIDSAYMKEYSGKIDEAAAVDAVGDSALLRNGGLEVLNNDGSIFAWDTWPGNPAEGESLASVSAAEKHSGNQSLCIELTKNNVQAVYQYNLKADGRFDFQDAYVFSAWVKLDSVKLDAGNTIQIGVKRKGADGSYYNVYNEVDGKIEGWHKIRVVVPKALVEISQYDVIMEIGSGSGKIYMDDFLLEKATAEDLAGLEKEDMTEQLSAKTKLIKTAAQSSGGKKDFALPAAIALTVIAVIMLAGTIGLGIRWLLKVKKTA